MRLTAPGAPSLMETGLGADRGWYNCVGQQIHHRQVAAKKTVGHQLLAHNVHRGAIDQRVAGAAGNVEIVLTGQEHCGWAAFPTAGQEERSTAPPEAVKPRPSEPPHSGPQLSTYAVPPSAEKTALTGRSKASGACSSCIVLSGLCAWKRHQPGAFCGSQSTAPWARWQGRRSRRWSAQPSVARIVDVVRVLNKGQRHGAAGIHADPVHAGKAEADSSRRWSGSPP